MVLLEYLKIKKIECLENGILVFHKVRKFQILSERMHFQKFASSLEELLTSTLFLSSVILFSNLLLHICVFLPATLFLLTPKTTTALA